MRRASSSDIARVIAGVWFLPSPRRRCQPSRTAASKVASATAAATRRSPRGPSRWRAGCGTTWPATAQESGSASDRRVGGGRGGVGLVLVVVLLGSGTSTVGATTSRSVSPAPCSTVQIAGIGGCDGRSWRSNGCWLMSSIPFSVTVSSTAPRDFTSSTLPLGVEEEVDDRLLGEARLHLESGNVGRLRRDVPGAGEARREASRDKRECRSAHACRRTPGPRRPAGCNRG